ncbi:MAG: response regulator [Planctomycetota bacterium]|nr:MAG: response regulator [Planctomycetota bacterium]
MTELSQRRLSASIATVVGITMLTMTGAVYLLLIQGARQQTWQYEYDRAAHAIVRLRDALEITAENLGMKVQDWSIFDDSYEFVSDRNERFIEANLSGEATEILGIEAIVYFTAEGNEHYRFIYQGLEEQEYTAIDRQLSAMLADENIQKLIMVESAAHGLAAGAEASASLFASHPIYRSDGSGPANGRLVFWTRLGASYQQKLNRLLGEDVRLHPLSASTAPTDAYPLELPAAWVLEQARHTIAIADLNDVFGVPIMRASMDLGTGMRLEVQRYLRFTLLALIGISALGTLVILVLLQQRVVRRVRDLDGDLAAISATAASDKRVRVIGHDELSSLALRVNQTLESLDRARLNSEQLRQDAEAANQAKTAFINTLSHEIRTPLNGILGMATILSRSQLSSQQHGYLESMQACSQTLIGLLNEALDLAKIEAGRFDLHLEPHCPAGVLRQACQAFLHQGLVSAIELRAGVAAELPPLLSIDAQRLQQIYHNLLSNALKFTAQGSIEAGLELCHEDEQGLLLRGWVTDSGIGMSEEQIANLFQPFSQADSSIQHRYGGSGLGLSLCRGFAEAMGGNMGAESTPGKGSRIWFTFRATAPPAATSPASIARLKRLGLIAVDASQDLKALKTTDCEILRYDSWQAWQKSPAGEQALIISGESEVELQALQRALLSDDHQLPPILILAPQRPQSAWLHAFAGAHGVIQHSHNLDLLTDQWQKALSWCSDHSPRYRWPAQHHILVVDDSAINRQVVSHLLESHGLQVSSVETGQAALDWLEAHPCPAAILMDGRMPGMDGFATTKAIRNASQAYATVPVIGLSADVIQDSQDRALAAGMQAMLYKPIDELALLNTLAQYMPGSEAISPSPSQAPPPPRAKPPQVFLALVSQVGEEIAQELIQAFSLELHEHRHNIRHCLDKADRQGASDAVHRLAGTAGTLGFTTLDELSQKLLKACRSGGAADELDRLRSLVEAEIELQRQNCQDWLDSAAG